MTGDFEYEWKSKDSFLEYIEREIKKEEKKARQEYLNWRLRCSVSEGNLLEVSVLLEAGAKAIMPDTKILFFVDRYEILEMLLKNGANIEERDDKGRTLLIDLCCRIGWDIKNFVGFKCIELIDWLLSKGADINAKDNDENTGLFFAVEYCLELAELLLDKGADIKARNNLGLSPLLLAVKLGRINTVKLLISRGAPLQTKDLNGKTALFYAVESKNSKMVSLLLEEGATVKEEDKDIFGKNVLYYAKKSGINSIINEIYEKMYSGKKKRSFWDIFK